MEQKLLICVLSKDRRTSGPETNFLENKDLHFWGLISKKFSCVTKYFLMC